MFLRLLDTLLPATVLVALVLALASAFGALSAPPAAQATPVVTLERVVIVAEREIGKLPLARAGAERATTVR
ncbi:MAG TPA: hypothetical protein VLI72_09115 [Methylibium sp.]|nr:hypothetical protein [Methylibium sp.]